MSRIRRGDIPLSEAHTMAILYRQGNSCAVIGQMKGRSASVVWKQLKRVGCPMRRPGSPP